MNSQKQLSRFFAIINCMAICQIATCKLVEKPVDTEVVLGDSTYLNCSTSSSSEKVSWYHYPFGKPTTDHNYIYVNGEMLAPYDNRFRIESNEETHSYNLIITGTEQSDAGTYVCQSGGELGQPAELIVLDSAPVCESNIRPIGFIGPNSCNLQTDSIQLSYSMKYSGNISPKLNCMLLLTNNEPTPLYGALGQCRHVSGEVKCYITLEIRAYMDGSKLICQSDRSRNVRNYCASETIRVQYAIRYNMVKKRLADEVICSARTSVYCKYKWIWYEDDTEETVYHKGSLILKMPGWYRCEADCQIKDNSCKFIAMSLEVQDDAKTSHTDSPNVVHTLVIISIVAVILIAALYLICCWRRRERRGNHFKIFVGLGSIIAVLLLALIAMIIGRTRDGRTPRSRRESDDLEQRPNSNFEADEIENIASAVDSSFPTESEHVLNTLSEKQTVDVINQPEATYSSYCVLSDRVDLPTPQFYQNLRYYESTNGENESEENSHTSSVDLSYVNVSPKSYVQPYANVKVGNRNVISTELENHNL